MGRSRSASRDSKSSHAKRSRSDREKKAKKTARRDKDVRGVSPPQPLPASSSGNPPDLTVLLAQLRVGISQDMQSQIKRSTTEIKKELRSELQVTNERISNLENKQVQSDRHGGEDHAAVVRL